MSMAKQRPNATVESAGPWIGLVGLILLELLVAIGVPPDAVAGNGVLSIFTRIIEAIAPVVGHFDKVAKHPDHVRLFLAVTVLLIPVKTYCCFQILNGDRLGFYRHWIVSPLTERAPPPARDVLKDSADLEGKSGVGTPLSMKKRWAYAIFLLLMSTGMLISRLVLFGWQLKDGGTSAIETERGFREIANGGFDMWLAWSLYRSTAIAFFLAIGLNVLRDTVKYFRQRVA